MRKLIDVETHYPSWICNDCGKKHGKRPSGNPYGATYHEGQCEVCFQIKQVTEPRDFSHLKPSYKKDVKKFWK